MQVTSDVVYPLRHAVLRTGRQWADVIYSADADPLSAHFAAISEHDDPSGSEEAMVLAVGSVLPEAPEWDDRTSAGEAWRVRGMAVRADSRGSGLGTQILGCLIAHVSANGGGLVWCTARLAAISLYKRAGLRARGVPGEVRGIGPHQVMFGMVASSPGIGPGPAGPT